MKIAVLTSSRADYSIYYPLLKELQSDSFFELNLVVFGTHLSKQHGYTADKIVEDGFEIAHSLETIPRGDSPEAIASCMGSTILTFSYFWAKEHFDLVFCLGDRYEMHAAVTASVPFNIPIAHISGGETTLGAIDEIFRHSLSLMSSYHFVSADPYKKRVVEVTGSDKNVFNVGALSIDNLKSLELYSIQEFKQKHGIDLSIPSILITFQPETVAYAKNKEYIDELVRALEILTNDYQLVITMPNADTMGNVIRERFNEFISKRTKAIGVESFGTIGYLSCMKHCSFMLGNTSSGFVEASFFPKFVINLGERQLGRIVTPNIFNCPIDKEAILKCVSQIEEGFPLPEISIYGKGDAAKKIIQVLKSHVQ